jgi:hypothetical protein
MPVPQPLQKYSISHLFYVFPLVTGLSFVPRSGQIPVDGYEWRAPFHQKRPQGLITTKLKGI